MGVAVVARDGAVACILAGIASNAGRPLPPGPGPMRDWFRQAMKRPEKDPVRMAVQEWIDARSKLAPEFAIPADWYPFTRRKFR